MMKHLLIIIFTLFSLQSFGQQAFFGTYFSHPKDIGFLSEIFQFEEDGTFQYFLLGCEGIDFGQGEYEITEDDSLKLWFVDSEIENIRKQIEFHTNSEGNLEIDLQIKRLEDGNNIEGATVAIRSTMTGVVSDYFGKAQLTTTKFQTPQRLRIEYLGFNSVEIEIPPSCTQVSGTIRLSDNWFYNSSDNMAYKIISWKKAGLVCNCWMANYYFL